MSQRPKSSYGKQKGNNNDLSYVMTQPPTFEQGEEELLVSDSSSDDSLNDRVEFNQYEEKTMELTAKKAEKVSQIPHLHQTLFVIEEINESAANSSRASMQEVHKKVKAKVNKPTKKDVATKGYIKKMVDKLSIPKGDTKESVKELTNKRLDYMTKDPYKKQNAQFIENTPHRKTKRNTGNGQFVDTANEVHWLKYAQAKKHIPHPKLTNISQKDTIDKMFSNINVLNLRPSTRENPPKTGINKGKVFHTVVRNKDNTQVSK